MSREKFDAREFVVRSRESAYEVLKSELDLDVVTPRRVFDAGWNAAVVFLSLMGAIPASTRDDSAS